LFLPVPPYSSLFLLVSLLTIKFRFWGQRLHDLRISPPPVHIQEFPGVCCDYVDKVLAKDSIYSLAAASFAEELRATFEDDPEGLTANLEAILALMEGLEPYNTQKKKSKGFLKKNPTRAILPKAFPSSEAAKHNTNPLPWKQGSNIDGHSIKAADTAMGLVHAGSQRWDDHKGKDKESEI
jgi:hypothetical protein